MLLASHRITRLTSAFSKQIDNLAHAVALHFMHDNFGHSHSTLSATPAMAAGVSESFLADGRNRRLERYPAEKIKLTRDPQVLVLRS